MEVVAFVDTGSIYAVHCHLLLWIEKKGTQILIIIKRGKLWRYLMRIAFASQLLFAIFEELSAGMWSIHNLIIILFSNETEQTF